MFGGIGSKRGVLAKKSSGASVSYLYNEGVNASAWIEGYVATSSSNSQSKESTFLSFSVFRGERTYVTDQTVNFTGITKIGIDLIWSRPGLGGNIGLVISSDKTSSRTVYDIIFTNTSIVPTGSRATALLDVSLSGNYYVRFHVWQTSGSTSTTASVYKLWLE